MRNKQDQSCGVGLSRTDEEEDYKQDQEKCCGVGLSCTDEGEDYKCSRKTFKKNNQEKCCGVGLSHTRQGRGLQMIKDKSSRKKSAQER